MMRPWVKGLLNMGLRLLMCLLGTIVLLCLFAPTNSHSMIIGIWIGYCAFSEIP